MSGNDEHEECPLCMEPLEIDDINFFPCTCGYQICRFCWHRIRTDENGLCPACRKAYPEDPAQFNPLTEDELQRIKKERRQKDLQRKQKAAENRKHLANVRVVQKNLVFVVGLSQRLAETEMLKKHEYFGKFGKIHKVVINQSTSYAGAQGPSASAYVTYNKPDDALKAIIAVNNVHIDGRTLKASLGTTKYCSHFLRGTQCPKTDCMYLHELGEEAASFTKEEMQVGKHQEYEQKLLETYMNSQNTANNHQNTNHKIASTSRKKTSSPTGLIQPSQSPPDTQLTPSPPDISTATQQTRQNTNTSTQQVPPNTANKDAWPSLQQSGGTKGDKVLTNGTVPHNPNITDNKSIPDKSKLEHNRAPGKNRPLENTDTIQQRPQDTYTIQQQQQQNTENVINSIPISPVVTNTSPRQHSTHSIISSLGNKHKSLGLDTSDSLSLFSSTNGYHGVRNPKPMVQQTEMADVPQTEIPETITVQSTTDWSAAFGFGQSNSTSKCKDWQDDDLGFDPLEESSRGLADLLEKENGQKLNNSMGFTSMFPQSHPHSRPVHNHMSQQNIPPGFSLSHMPQPSHIASQSTTQPIQQRSTLPSYPQTDVLTSRMMGYVNSPMQNTYTDMFSDLSLLGGSKDHLQQHNRTQKTESFTDKNWQDGLRALLPNINISFGSQQADRQQLPQHNSQKNWDINTSTSPSVQVQNNNNNNKWTVTDPAILTSATMADGSPLQEPHWLKSINQLTDLDTTSSRLPFVQQFPTRNTVWPPQTHNPPPGFQTHIRPPLQTHADPHKLSEGLQ